MLSMNEAFSVFRTEDESDAYLTEILHPKDPRASCEKMTDAKKKEVASPYNELCSKLP